MRSLRFPHSELLDLAGCIVTPDAMGTQKSIAHQIHTAGADYILSLKSNHPTLFQQVEQWFQQMQADAPYPPHVNTPLSLDITASTRTVWTLSVDCLLPSIKQTRGQDCKVVIVERTRRLWNKTTHEVQFYLSSLPPHSPWCSLIENGPGSYVTFEDCGSLTCMPNLAWYVSIVAPQIAAAIRQHWD